MSVACDVYGITFCGIDELLDTERKLSEIHVLILNGTAMRTLWGRRSGYEVRNDQTPQNHEGDTAPVGSQSYAC